MLGWERRRPRVPTKLRIAEEDAATKPPEVKATVVRSAFAAISSRFPVSLQDLQAFVKAHGLGIAPATLREMVGKASAKRQNWQARGRDLPLRVMRDELWVEDVMWALRVRKTRREFDKWEVNDHRDKWVSILEAATPDNPTVFATSPDHRIAPPLSYTELLQDARSSSPVAFRKQTPAGCNSSAGGGSGGSWKSKSRSSNAGRGGSSGSSGRRTGGGGGSTGAMSRPSTTGKLWTPLESRSPTSLLLTSRPGSAVEVGAGGNTAATTGEGTTFVTSGKAWAGEGGVGDPTVCCVPGWFASGGNNGRGNGHGGSGGGGGGDSEGYGGGRWPALTPQERALFGRKPSPATVARSTSYAPRRRPPRSADGRCSRPETGSGDDTAEVFEMERDINSSSFALTATSDLSTTATPRQRGPGDGRGGVRGVWGSVASTLTFDNSADVSHGKSAAAAAGGAEAARATEAGAATEGTKTAGEREGAEEEAAVETVQAARKKMNNSLDASGISKGEGEREREGEGAAEWWRGALGPTSRRPVTRRSLISGGVAVGGARNASCTWLQLEEGKARGGRAPRGESGWSHDGMVYGGDGGNASGGCGGGGGGPRPWSSAAPICDFSTELKQRNLEEFLNRRSSIDELEGLASTRVRGCEAALARARSGTRFCRFVGRDTIRQNYDRSLRNKACETLSLDLRGYGTHLTALDASRAAKHSTARTSCGPVATDDDDDHRQPLPSPRRYRCATAGAATGRLRARATTKAWSSSKIEGSNNGGGGNGGGGGGVPGVGSLPSPTTGGGCVAGGGPAGGGPSRPPPFGPMRGTTVQEARTTVAIDQAGLWGKCAQGHFGRFEEKPYLHTFR
ncbi:unnamed protein product [Pylaiella littoralis]